MQELRTEHMLITHYRVVAYFVLFLLVYLRTVEITISPRGGILIRVHK